MTIATLKKNFFLKMFLLVLKKQITKANQITKECLVCLVCEEEKQEIELEKGRD